MPGRRDPRRRSPPTSSRASTTARSLEYAYDTSAQRTGITSLLRDLSAAGLVLRDVQTRQDSLEDIFVGLVREGA